MSTKFTLIVFYGDFVLIDVHLTMISAHTHIIKHNVIFVISSKCYFSIPIQIHTNNTLNSIKRLFINNKHHFWSFYVKIRLKQQKFIIIVFDAIGVGHFAYFTFYLFQRVLFNILCLFNLTLSHQPLLYT